LAVAVGGARRKKKIEEAKGKEHGWRKNRKLVLG
jgi:hypothetical protein